MSKTIQYDQKRDANNAAGSVALMLDEWARAVARSTISKLHLAAVEQ